MRRLSTRLSTLLLLVGLLLVGHAPVQAAPGEDAHADRAAAWLRSQLQDGLLEQFAGSPDYGLTLDTVLGLRAAGATPTEVKPILDAMAGIADVHLEYEGSVTSGLAGKALVAAHVSDYPVRDFHGHDLVALAESTVDDSGRVHGGEHDNVNIFSQTWVMIGLAQQDMLPPSTVGFLLDQQCNDGYFRMYYSDGRTCDEAGSGYDVDGTVFALFALEAALDAGIDDAAAPLELGREWLVDHQGESGGFGSSASTPAENTNSTGLAVAALKEHDPAAARDAAAWVGRLVYDSGPDEGAVAYLPTNREGWAPGTALTSAQRGGAIRATPQALLAFAPVNYAFIPDRVGTGVPGPTAPAERRPPTVRPGLPPTGC